MILGYIRSKYIYGRQSSIESLTKLTLIKALEKLCVWESDKALQSNPVHTRQHGFRADRNTVTAISEVTDFIEQNIYFNKHVLAVFLDIQAAFDTISPEKIKKVL